MSSNGFGVKIYPVEDHTIEKGKHPNQIILGFGHLKNEDIKEGVTRLYQAIYNGKSKSNSRTSLE